MPNDQRKVFSETRPDDVQQQVLGLVAAKSEETI
jgi:hypothetical protein